MKTTKALFAVATVAASALLWTACTHGAQLAPGGIPIDRDDIAGATNYVRAALDAGLAGTPIAVAQTQPYGCDVKY